MIKHHLEVINGMADWDPERDYGIFFLLSLSEEISVSVNTLQKKCQWDKMVYAVVNNMKIHYFRGP